MQDTFSQTYTGIPTLHGIIWDSVDLTTVMPMELVLTALVRCTVLTLDSILSKQRQSVTHYLIHVTAHQRAAHPQVWESIALDIRCSGDALTDEMLERTMHIVPRYCPVHATLSQTATIHHDIRSDTTPHEEHP